MPLSVLTEVSQLTYYSLCTEDWLRVQPPPHTSTNSQTRNRLSSLFTHLHLHTVLLHKREQLDIDHTFLPEEGIPVPSFDLEPKSILNKSFVACCFLKRTGVWKLLSWCINLQNLQSHWFSFDMKTKTSPGNPQLHFSLFDLSVCLFHQPHADALLCLQAQCVCICAHDIKSVMGLSFSPPDRLNPRENTVIGATTPASPASTHTHSAWDIR